MEPKYYAFRFGDCTPQSSAENMTNDAYGKQQGEGIGHPKHYPCVPGSKLLLFADNRGWSSTQ